MLGNLLLLSLLLLLILLVHLRFVAGRHDRRHESHCVIRLFCSLLARALLVTPMNANVLRQIIRSRKHLAALLNRTLKGTLARVDAHVTFQVLSATEHLVTLIVRTQIFLVRLGTLSLRLWHRHHCNAILGRHSVVRG